MADVMGFDDARREHMRRINQIDKVIIVHDALTRIMGGVKDCILWSESSSEPFGALLSGDAGLGKSTLANMMLDLFRPSREEMKNDRSVKIVPAYYAAIPEAASPKDTGSSLLKALGDPKPYNGPLSSVTQRLIRLLEECGTRFIILDEFHHLLLKGVKTAEHVCNWIKTLVNETRVLICLVGSPRCAELLQENDQLARRFANRFELGPLVCGDESIGGQLDAFMVAYRDDCMQKLQMQMEVDFQDYLHVWRIGLASGGVPAYIQLLFKEAALSALSNGREIITMADFAKAYKKGITFSVSKIGGDVNPFAINDTQVKAAGMRIKIYE